MHFLLSAYDSYRPVVITALSIHTILKRYPGADELPTVYESNRQQHNHFDLHDPPFLFLLVSIMFQSDVITVDSAVIASGEALLRDRFYKVIKRT